MGLVKRALAPAEVRSTSRRMPSLSGRGTGAAVTVDPERSLQIGAVYSCVRLLSEAVAGLPVSMFEEVGEQKKPIVSDPILYLVSVAPNPVIDAGEFWRTIVGWMLLRGNAYAYIERNGAGMPVALWPLSPSSIEVGRRANGELVYTVNTQDDEYAPLDKGEKVIADNMLHYRAFGLGVEGLSPIGLARQSVGLSFAAQQYMAGFYARDATPGGSIVVDGELSDTAYERMERQWKDLHEGWSNSNTMAIMEGGAKWAQTTLSPQDAQFIETQKFSRSEIASIYGVPPHMIGDTEKSTSWGSGLAEQGIGFVTYSLRPWLQRLERVTRRRLLMGRQANRGFRWQVEGLMQGDLKARYDAYAVGKQWGWLSTNDIRRKEGEPTVDGGDTYLQPLNMVPAGQLPVAPANRSVKGRPAHRDAQMERWIELHRDELAAAFEAQRADVAASGSLDRAVWDSKLAEVLRNHAVRITDDVATSVAASLGGTFDLGIAAAFLEAVSSHRAKNLNITTETQLAEGDVDAVFDHAVNDRAGLAAEAYATQTVQFARTEGGKQAGATRKKWVVRSANPRPSHSRMNGETVGIDERFSNEAMWPGDYASGVDEVAGCTCEVQILTD